MLHRIAYKSYLVIFSFNISLPRFVYICVKLTKTNQDAFQTPYYSFLEDLQETFKHINILIMVLKQFFWTKQSLNLASKNNIQVCCSHRQWQIALVLFWLIADVAHYLFLFQILSWHEKYYLVIDTVQLKQPERVRVKRQWNVHACGK